MGSWFSFCCFFDHLWPYSTSIRSTAKWSWLKHLWYDSTNYLQKQRHMIIILDKTRGHTSTHVYSHHALCKLHFPGFTGSYTTSKDVKTHLMDCFWSFPPHFTLHISRLRFFLPNLFPRSIKSCQRLHYSWVKQSVLFGKVEASTCLAITSTWLMFILFYQTSRSWKKSAPEIHYSLGFHYHVWYYLSFIARISFYCSIRALFCY